MLYTLNIEPINGGRNRYRLDKNMNWTYYPFADVLSNENYFTRDKNEIIRLQKPDVLQFINGVEYMIEPDECIDSYAGNKLFYEIYLFRDSFPKPPDKEQLIDVLLKGDDSARNDIVLKTDGTFCLFQQQDLLWNGVSPDIVVQYEGMQHNQGYVGAIFDDRPCKDYVSVLFNSAMQHWLNHLLSKKLHLYRCIPINTKSRKLQSLSSINYTLSMLEEVFKKVPHTM